MPKYSRKKQILEDIESFGSLSSISSESSGLQVYQEDMPRLNKKDLMELVKLQRKIKEEQQKLRAISQKAHKKGHTKNEKATKSRNKSPINILTNLISSQTTDTKQPSPYQFKIYLTGFGPQLTYQQLKPQIKSLLVPFKGFCQHKLKTKKGDTPYVIMYFQDHDLAEKVTKILKNVKILGKKVNVLMMKDNLNDLQPKRRCYQCQQTGHFGRQCPIRIQKQKNALKFFQQNVSTEIREPQIKSEEPIKNEPKEQRSNYRQVQQKQKKPSQNKRVTRDKSRLQRIIHDDV